ncbi:MAG: hypothetical protein QOI04_98 [Verrucomicrobiota bacterium]|jgi:hypothetical protein
MTLFELTFGLTALILGLALTHMASNLYRLAKAGRKVRWAPEPLLQTGLVLLVVVFVWVNQWETRGTTSIIYARELLQVLKLLVLYIAAAACLPEVHDHEGEIDLYVHYDQTRRLSYGALVAGLVLFDVYGWTGEQTFHWCWNMLASFVFIGPYLVMMFVRQRWLNVLLLVSVLIYFGSSIMAYRLNE